MTTKDYVVDLKLKLDRPLEEFGGRREFKKYIQAAVARWGKSFAPDDPFFEGILGVEVGTFKDTDVTAAKSRAGKARAESLSPRKRKRIAQGAAKARWDKVRAKEQNK